MPNPTNPTHPALHPAIQVPLGQTAHDRALQFSKQQSSTAQGKQVYLQTLAVYAVQNWLSWMHIETDWTNSMSAQASLLGLLNLADLWLPHRGRLICQGVLPGVSTAEIPAVGPETVGCAVVQFSAALDQAEILGFTRQAQADQSFELPLDDLQPLEELLAHLMASEPQPTVAKVNLQGWLEGAIEQGWQSLETLLGSAQNDGFLAYRSSRQQTRTIQKVKRIQGPAALAEQAVLLLVAISQEERSSGADAPMEVTTQVQVRLHPEVEQAYLPPGIQLALLGPDQRCLQQVCARIQDNFIQLPLFRCAPGEEFGLQVVFGEVCVNETFVV